MNTHLLKWKSALLAALAATVALASEMVAASGGPHCQRIQATGFTPASKFQLPCEEDPSFFACQIGSTRGSFKSTWELYFTHPPEDLANFGVPVPPDALRALYQDDIEVFRTSRGTINGYAHYVMDDRMFETGGFIATVFVTSGTGIYQDATGWISTVATNGTVERYVIVGRVCGPNIPHDEIQQED